MFTLTATNHEFEHKGTRLAKGYPVRAILLQPVLCVGLLLAAPGLHIGSHAVAGMITTGSLFRPDSARLLDSDFRGEIDLESSCAGPVDDHKPQNAPEELSLLTGLPLMAYPGLQTPLATTGGAGATGSHSSISSSGSLP